MGTGSFAGGGSGALGRSGSGARLATRPSGPTKESTPASNFLQSRGTPNGPSFDSARALVRETFAQRGVANYMSKLLSSFAVRGCFEELFFAGVLLARQQNWASIEKHYGVRNGPGCLADLATAIKRKHTDSQSLEAFHEIAGAVVDDVLMAAVGDDDDTYLDGRANDVFAGIRKHGEKIFSSLSGYYLGRVLYRAATRELPALDERQKLMLQKGTQERADFLIAKFKYSFLGKTLGKKQTTYRQLLKIFSENTKWFQGNLRQEISQ